MIARGDDLYELVHAGDDRLPPPPPGFAYHEEGIGVMVDLGQGHEVLCTPVPTQPAHSAGGH